MSTPLQLVFSRANVGQEVLRVFTAANICTFQAFCALTDDQMKGILTAAMISERSKTALLRLRVTSLEEAVQTPRTPAVRRGERIGRDPPLQATRNATSAIPLVLPTKVALRNDDPAFLSLDATLRASGFQPTPGRPRPNATTYIHPSHPPVEAGFTGFVVTNAGRELLRGLGDQRVGVLAAVGPFRKGKSTFLSQVVQWGGHTHASFRSSSSSESCTMGIWAWPELLTLPDEASADIMKWLVLDVEGFFASDSLNGRSNDPDYYARLFGIATLLSSVVVYFDHIERSVSSRDLDVFPQLSERIRTFCTLSATLFHALRDNRRPFVFLARDWKARPAPECTLEADMIYWEGLQNVASVNEVVDMISSDFQFATLPVFSSDADPESLRLGDSSDAYKHKFGVLMRNLLTPSRATTYFVVSGVVAPGTGSMLEHQLTTLAEAFSQLNVTLSADHLRTHAARFRVENAYDRAESDLQECYDNAARRGVAFVIESDLKRDMLRVLAGVHFSNDDVSVAQLSYDPMQRLNDIVANILQSVRRGINAEALPWLDRIPFGSIAHYDNPCTLIDEAVDRSDVPQPVKLRLRELAFNYLQNDAIKSTVDTVWATISADLQHREQELTELFKASGASAEESIPSARHRLLRDKEAQNIISQCKYWLRVELQRLFDGVRVALAQQLTQKAQEIASNAMRDCLEDVSIQVPTVRAVVSPLGDLIVRVEFPKTDGHIRLPDRYLTHLLQCQVPQNGLFWVEIRNLTIADLVSKIELLQ